MHASGNPNQWVAGYPSRTLIEEDIARGVSYVVDRDSVIEAVFSYIEDVYKRQQLYPSSNSAIARSLLIPFTASHFFQNTLTI